MQTAYVEQRYCHKRIELVRIRVLHHLFVCISVCLSLFISCNSALIIHFTPCPDAMICLNRRKSTILVRLWITHFHFKKLFKHSELHVGCNFIGTFLYLRKGRNPKKLASTENETSKIAPIREFLQNGLARTRGTNNEGSYFTFLRHYKVMKSSWKLLFISLHYCHSEIRWSPPPSDLCSIHFTCHRKGSRRRHISIYWKSRQGDGMWCRGIAGWIEAQC